MCMDSCLKGRQGICCFGCSTRLGINLIGMLSLAEVALIGYLFFNELSSGEFNLKVCAWFLMVTVRSLAYLADFCDSISRRRKFMYTLIVTTILEIVMFTILNVSLFTDSGKEVAFRIFAAWGMGQALQIAAIEILSIVHILMFAYFSAIAYEFYCMACDDPKMIDAEHKAQASKEKAAAAERKRRELELKQKQEKD